MGTTTTGVARKTLAEGEGKKKCDGEAVVFIVLPRCWDLLRSVRHWKSRSIGKGK
jgi:hypothetical protein